MYQLYDKNRDRLGTGAKPVKTASFFIKTGFSFVKNGLQSRLRSGCAHHGGPGAGEVRPRVYMRPFRRCGRCLSAMLEVLYAPFLPLFRRRSGRLNKNRPSCPDPGRGLLYDIVLLTTKHILWE